MNEWKTYRLGEIVDLFDHKRIPLSSSQRLKRKGIYPYYGAQGIIDYIDDYIFDGEFLLVAEDGENLKSKKQDIAQIAKGKYWVNNHAHILKSNGLCNLTYLCYILNRTDISGYITGSAQPKLNQANLLSITLSLPSIEEQNKIASFILSFDDKIELNRRINANLEAQAQALFRSWFVDFEPFRDGPFVDSELGKIPQGWKVGDIYTYMDVIYGAPYKSALFNTDKKGYPLIRIRDLKTYSPQFYTEEILPNTEYVDFGDIVAGMDAEFVPYIWKGEKGLLNQRVCKFIPKYDYVSKYYILSLIRPELEFVQSYKVGTTVSHLGKSDIDKFKVITPPAEIVKRFSCIVDSFHQQIIKLAKENLNLSALRDTLLPKLMAGEINVE